MGNVYNESSKKKGCKMIEITTCIILCGLVVAVANLKSKLNIAEDRLATWRQHALELNNTLRR